MHPLLPRRAAAPLALALAGLLLLAGAAWSPAGAASPAQAGLYGSADPTYDGVFRQSLAIIAHEAAGSPVPADARQWLLDQQCADGGFQALRTTPSTACTASDPVNYQGEDTNSTALAAIALRSLGRTAEADRAIAWLESARNADGGFPYFVGGQSDANSTADVLLALNGSGAPGSSTGPAAHFLATLQLRCDGVPTDDDGALAFQDYGTGLVSNDAATVQSVVALAGATLPVAPGASSGDVPRLTCPEPVPADATTPAELGAGYLARLIDAYSGAVPVLDYNSGTRTPGSVSAGDTAWAVLALAATGLGSVQSNAALATVTDKAAAPSAQDDPGLLALAALATHAAGGDATAVTAYVEAIDATMRTAPTPTPTPTPTATGASPTTTSGATADATSTGSASDLPPTGATPLTPALAGSGLALLALGLVLLASTRRRGAHA